MLRSDHSAFSSGSPFALVRWAVLPLVCALALGCTPKIGDECTVSTNCSAAGDRLCDITQPGGYCTIFNCEPGTCPADSVCINFGTNLATADMCTPSQGNSPYQRSFCMASCDSNGDCRGGYQCLNLSGALDADGKPTNPVGAVLAEGAGANPKVCTGSTSVAGAGGSSAGTGGNSAEAGAAGEGGSGG